MRVSIWDMDYFHKLSFKPNITVMQLSSLHKQSNHLINFIERTEQISDDFDLMYIIRVVINTPFPPSFLLDNHKVKLIGEEFRFFPNYYEPDIIVDMLRPDYSLYRFKEQNIYKTASLIRVLHKDKKISIRQNFETTDTASSKVTVVTDELLWKVKTNVLAEILDELLAYNNLYFESEIDLKIILTNQNILEKFLALHFSKYVDHQFCNDYGDSIQHAKQIIDFMRELKNKNPRVRFRPVVFKTVIYQHWDTLSDGIVDLERCLQIMDYAKEHKVLIHFQSSQNRLITPFWPFFEVLDIWSHYHPYKSFIQFMLEPSKRRQKIKWYEVLNNPQKWYSPRSDFLLHLMVTYPSVIANYGTRLWGIFTLPLEYININQVSKYAFIFEQEAVKEKLQKELIGDEVVISRH
jgi:hypothetical protein